MLLRLDKPAWELMRAFFLHYPQLEVYEGHDHGVGPLDYPDLYITTELVSEPVHERILAFAEENRGVLTRPLIEAWIGEEMQEVRDRS